MIKSRFNASATKNPYMTTCVLHLYLFCWRLGFSRLWLSRLHCGNQHSSWWPPWSNRGILAMVSATDFLGSGHHGLPVVIAAARGNLVCGCLSERVPTFVPFQICTRYPIRRGLFRQFQPSINIGRSGTITSMKS